MVLCYNGSARYSEDIANRLLFAAPIDLLFPQWVSKDRVKLKANRISFTVLATTKQIPSQLPFMHSGWFSTNNFSKKTYKIFEKKNTIKCALFSLQSGI